MTKSLPAKVAITCGGCGAKREAKRTPADNPRTPGGWKKRTDPDTGADMFTCKDCWKKLYRLRAVTFPVQGVHDGGSWADFCVAVRQALFRSRSLAQWAINRLGVTDVSRTLAMQKLLPHPPLGAADKVYLYGLAAREFADWGEWAGAYTCAQGILRLMEAKYNSRRVGIIWRADTSVPTVRSCPYPVPAANWTAEYVETTNEETGQSTRVPAVNLPLLGQRWLLRLRGGKQRARQLAAFRQIVSGEAEQCELQIYRKRSQANRDRSGTTERNGGSVQVRYDIMVKLVAWLPRETREGAKRQGALTVHSSKNAFLVAVHPDFERPWIVCRNDVRARIIGHAARLERISCDMKAETRPRLNPPGPWQRLSDEERKARRTARRQRKRRQGFLDTITRNFDAWHDSIVKEMASWLAKYADRVGVAKVYLDLGEHDYCPGFRWAALRDRIVQNCADLSPPIAVEVGSEEDNGVEDKESS